MPYDTVDTSRNEKDLRIPANVRIGVTGHRKLANKELLSESVRSVLTQICSVLILQTHFIPQ